MKLRQIGRPLPEWEPDDGPDTEPHEESRDTPYIADAKVAVVGVDIPFWDVFAVVAKIVFSLLLLGLVLGLVLAIPALLIYQGVFK